MLLVGDHILRVDVRQGFIEGLEVNLLAVN
jgi:hypothetical protein